MPFTLNTIVAVRVRGPRQGQTLVRCREHWDAFDEEPIETFYPFQPGHDFARLRCDSCGKVIEITKP